MLPKYTATQFFKEMTSGRTAPILCGCVDSDDNYVGEFVAKLLNGPTHAPNGALFEFVASRLARHFGILVPEPVSVEINILFGQVLAEHLPHRADTVKASIGLNFGSRLISPMIIWPVDKPISEAMRQDAIDIFAFDALIQNPDRRVKNPNLFMQGDNLYIFDHEISFSFLSSLGRSKEPWNLEEEPYLRDHVFYRRLRAKLVDLRNFSERLHGLSDEVLLSIRREVPAEWMHEDLERIETHLIEIRDHGSEFVEQVRRRLA